MTNSPVGANNTSRFTYHRDGTLPEYGAVFVFGSNLAGRHGAGAAKAAKDRFGARPGVGAGPMGDCYAIPTKDGRNGADLKDPRQSLDPGVVRDYVDAFVEHARAHPGSRFFVTRVGAGLAGQPDSVMAAMFAAAPENCSFATEWRSYLEPSSQPAPARPRPR